MRTQFRFITTVSFLLTLSSFSSVQAEDAIQQGPLTLEESIAEGMRQSPQIQRAEAAAEENRWKKYEAFGNGFLPKVNVFADHYFETQYQLSNIVFGGNAVQIPGIFPNNQVGVNASVSIFDGLASVHRFQAATLAEEASNEDLERARFELSQQIRLAFYQALAAVELEDVAHHNVSTLEDHLKQVDIRRNSGAATNYDSLRVQVQLTEARSDAIDAEDNVVITRKKLTQLLGMEDDHRPLQGTLPMPDTTKARSLEVKATTPVHRTDLKALDLRAEAAERVHSAESAWFIPAISIGGQYSYYDLQLYNGTTVVDNHDYRTAYNLGVFLSWNIFDGGVSYSRSRQADARRIQDEKASEAARLQVPYDFNYWKRRYLSNSDRFVAKQLDVTRSKESVRLAKEEERAGTRTSTETLDAEQDLFHAQAGVVNAQVSAAEALIRLELVLGTRL